MSFIRITSVPDGPNPLPIREAWIGLDLPLFYPEQVEPLPIEIINAVGDWDVWYWRLLIRLGWVKREQWNGFYVNSAEAIKILASAKPEAADWWCKEAPWMTQPGRALVFPAKCCSVVLSKSNDNSLERDA